MRLLSIRLLLAVILLLSPTLFAETATKIRVTNAEVRQPMLGRTVTAGYLTLLNKSQQSFDLVAVTSDAFERVELHQHSHVNGVMRMEQIASIHIKANSEVSLTPGGLHFMLFEPNKALAIGERITLQLQFSNDQVLDIKVPIVALPKR